MAHFQEFLQSDGGKTFVASLSEDRGPYDSLSNSLRTLFVSAAAGLSNETLKPTYDPMLEKMLEFVSNGARIMRRFGTSCRNPENPKEHSFKKNATTDEILNAIQVERNYHDTMFGTGRETIEHKSPSEMALTVVGLFYSAEQECLNGNSRLALKHLKDGVATGIRALEEAQLPGSIAEQSRQHYQKKAALN